MESRDLPEAAIACAISARTVAHGRKAQLLKMKPDERAKIIAGLIRAIWDSLESHLDVTYEKHPDGKDFHKKCVREYAETIVGLTKLF